jgi:hypothetical protein
MSYSSTNAREMSPPADAQVAIVDLPRFNEFRHHALNQRGGHSKPDAGTATTGTDNLRVDPDYFPVQIEQRTPAVAGLMAASV